MGCGESSNVASYKFEGAALHAVALYLPRNFFNTESGSVDEPCKKKQVMYLIGLLTNICLCNTVYTRCYVVITA